MKTIVAFANTQGGKLIVGIDDKTHEIEESPMGVPDDVKEKSIKMNGYMATKMYEYKGIPNGVCAK